MSSRKEIFSDVADPDEVFNWVAKPNQTCFIFFPALKLGAIGIAIVLFHFFIAKSPIINFAFVLLPLAFIVYIYRVFLYTNTFYTYSSKRILIKSGVFGIDYTIVDFKKISDYKVTVSPIENLFGVGSIHIYTPSNTERKQIAFRNIPVPFEVFKLLKSTGNNSDAN